jgi:hypothetical protein
VEERLRDLAAKQGRDVGVLVEDAVRDYLEAAAITDLGPADAAETQIALISELRDIAEWKGGRE